MYACEWQSRVVEGEVRLLSITMPPCIQNNLHNVILNLTKWLSVCSLCNTFPYQGWCEKNTFYTTISPEICSKTILTQTYSLILQSMYVTFCCCRANSHHYYGPPPEGNPGLLHLPCWQSESFPVPHPVHSGGGEATLNCTHSSLLASQWYCYTLHQFIFGTGYRVI